MVLRLFVCLMMLVMANQAASATEPQQPVSTNKVTGPVKGVIADRIDLSLNPFMTVSGLNGRSMLQLNFCTITTNYNNVTVNGQTRREARTDCIAPNRKLNLKGKRAFIGLKLSPELAGTWRWLSDYSLRFIPRQAWPTGQAYQLALGNDLFPAPVELKTLKLDFTTAALTAHVQSMNFFQDPSDMTQKGVTAQIRFNAAVKLDDVKSHVGVMLEELSDETKPTEKKILIAAAALPFDIKIDETEMLATVSIPLQTLPDKERFIRLDLSAGVTGKFGGAPLAADSNSRLSERVQIASRFSYAKLKDMELRVVKNDRYEPEQTVIITTNVPITAAELGKHLQLRLLPKDKPAAGEGLSPKKDYVWNSTFEVDDKLYGQLPEVPYKLNPTLEDYSTVHSAKLDTEAGRYVLARVTKDMAGKGEFVFATAHDQTLAVPAYQPEVKVLSDGALLAMSGAKKIAVYALGVKNLRYDIHRITSANIAHFISQSGGDFANPSFNYSFDENNLSEYFTQDASLGEVNPRKPQFTVFDFTPYLTAIQGGKSGLFSKDKPQGKGLFLLSVNGVEKDKDGKDRVVAKDRRFVLLSDLGLVVKTARDGTQDVFVQSVESGLPVGGAAVEVLGVNGLSVLRVETDHDGHASVPNLAGYENEKRPVAYLVKQGDDLAFMPYAHYDRALDYSRYETDGVQDSAEGLKAFLFSDRGIYRPGESMNLGVIVKQGDWAQDLSGLPLQLTISNPRGQVVEKSIVKLNASGFIDYQFATKDTSPTGVYNVRLTIGATEHEQHQLGSVAVRVEEFLPDTMKITSAFNKPQPKGWLKPDGLKADVTLMHLYGAPATEHRIKASLNLAPSNFAFKDYADYSFFDAVQAKKSFDQPIGEAVTDAAGKASFDLNLAQFGSSTYRLTFYGEGFAADSGRSVRTAKSVLISPLPYVVGMKPDSNLDYINKGSKVSVHLLALDPELKPLAAEGLTTQLLQINYVSTLIRDEHGAYVYRSKAKETLVAKGTLAIPASGLALPLESGKSGSYIIVISDAKGVVVQRFAYTVVGEGTMLGQARKDAVLSVKLDKEIYNGGDAINLNIVAPYTGAGLITLETDKVLTFKWFKSNSNSTVQSLPIPAGFSGKGFVNVQFLRALDSKEVYTKPLAYAVQPVFVSTAGVDSTVQLQVPEQVKPGENLTIQYQTKTAGKIIIYAVDEGILQYGHYVTPKPLDYFVGQRALQVSTAQILDLLMPEYGLLQQMAASGGDGGMSDGRNLNPFKRKTLPPVAYWSGIIDADNTARSVTYAVPDYFNGNLRIMAIAVSGKAMGAAETRTTVKGDMIITPNAPTFAAPDDEFVVGVSVANNLVGSGKDAKLTLSVTSSEHLEILDGKETALVIAEGTENKAQVKVRATSALGDARLRFMVKLGDKQVKAETSLSVRPPLPSMTALVAGYVPAGEKIVQQERALYSEFATADAALSTLPISLIPGLAAYLDRYPYGCSEQILSKAMPAVVLYGNKDLGGDSKIAEQSVHNTLGRLRELQRDNGSFGYWWRGGNSNDFVSVYALQYLLLAQEKHLPVPDDLLRRTETYAKQIVARVPNSLNEARVMAYAIYLLTRNGTVTANYLPTLLQYLENNQHDTWHNDLTAVYLAAAYRLMQLTPEANKLLDQFTLGDPAFWNNAPRYWYDNDGFYNSLNRYAQYLSVVARHFPERLPTLDRAILFRIANFIGEGSYNTLSSSYAIMAFSDYAAASTAQVAAQLSISQQDNTQAYVPLALTGEQVKRAKLNLAQAAVKFAGGGDLGLFYQMATDGYDKIKPVQPVEDGMEISRRYLNADNAVVKQAALGDVLQVVVTLRAHGSEDRPNIAVVDLLPAGFEVVPESVRQDTVQPQTESNEGEGEDASHDNAVPDDSVADEGDGSQWQTQLVDAREDRVIAFGTVPTAAVSFRYKIKAVNKGVFTTPPAYAESMYDRAIKARGVVDRLTVQ
jgi:uncharacterized repeat protein (TIGR01451 family)